MQIASVGKPADLAYAGFWVIFVYWRTIVTVVVHRWILTTFMARLLIKRRF